MNFNNITHAIILFAMVASSTAFASHSEIEETVLNTLPSTLLANNQIKSLIVDELLSCKIDSVTHKATLSSRNTTNKADKFFPQSLVYLNDSVKASYNTMRNEVIKHVTKKLALSLFNFSIDGFAPENLATYVSNGTKPFLPFEFANGVKITEVTPKGRTIIYRAEMPIAKSHRYAEQLALVGKNSATAIVCNDSEIVDGLLERGIVIQYDYYDANGIFFSSFTI